MQMIWDKTTRELMREVNKIPESEIKEFMKNKKYSQQLQNENCDLLQKNKSIKKEQNDLENSLEN
jgi:hypothetical protein